MAHPHHLNLSDFMTTGARKVLYGLPEKVTFCSACVLSNQKPNSSREFLSNKASKKVFMEIEERVCAACKFAKEKEIIDWSKRLNELGQLCDRFRGNGTKFDCLIPGSGGKDSVVVSAILKDEFGMTPLTATWSPHMYTTWGRINHERWLSSGFTNVTTYPNEKSHRVLTRLALEQLGNPFQPFILGQMAGIPRIAKMYGIRLIMYGESNVEYGNNQSEGLTSLKPLKYYSIESRERINLHLGGIPVDKLVKDYGLTRAELENYIPLSKDELIESDIEVHNMSYFKRWHPQDCYYIAADYSGFRPAPERSCGTYSRYSSIDDKLDDLHYWTTFIKFGIGRASYDASQEIRSGVIDRSEGVSLVNKFDGEYPSRFMAEIIDYLSLPAKEFPLAAKNFSEPVIDEEQLIKIVDSFRSPHLWDYVENKFLLRFIVE